MEITKKYPLQFTIFIIFAGWRILSALVYLHEIVN